MELERYVYLDYSASTPVDARVLEVMKPYFDEKYGNASSIHKFGRDAEDAVEQSREVVAGIWNCKPSEVVFTGGGSESDNLAIRGTAWMALTRGKGNHLITTPVEHPAVGKTVAQMADLMGFEKTILPVDRSGVVDVEDFAAACRSNTAIASIVYANNEIGTITPLPRFSDQAKAMNVLIHSDAVQAAGQLTLDVERLGVDLMSVSAHKFYGPKGVGALYVREGVELASNVTGGSHENGRRAGTLNTPAIVGLAEALRLAYEELDEHVSHYRMLRDMLITGITSRISGVQLSGHPEQRLPSHASFVFEDADTNSLLMHLDMQGVAASGGSACKTGNPEPSSVLLAMGYAPEQALGGLRLTVGRPTTAEDVEFVVDVLVRTVEKVRRLKAESS
jgi:cysteine desulfurase